MWRDVRDSALFWGSLPLIGLQGLPVKRRALRLPEAAGARSGIFGDRKPALRLLAIGDSIVAGVGVATVDQSMPVRLAAALAERSGRRVDWHCAGRNGAAAAELAELLDAGLARLPDPDLLAISVGVNDVTGLTPVARFVDALQSCRRRMQREAAQTRWLLAAVPPLQCFPLLPAPMNRLLGLRAAQLNRASARWAHEDNTVWQAEAPFLPGRDRFAGDGFHPDAASCAAWAAYLAGGSLDRWPELGRGDPASGA